MRISMATNLDTPENLARCKVMHWEAPVADTAGNGIFDFAATRSGQEPVLTNLKQGDEEGAPHRQ